LRRRAVHVAGGLEGVDVAQQLVSASVKVAEVGEVAIVARMVVKLLRRDRSRVSDGDALGRRRRVRCVGWRARRR